MAEYGKKLWDTWKIGYDDFVRTTDKNHEQQVQKIFEYLLEKGDIYKGKYVGNYCKSDESYFTDLQLVNGRCPDCGKEVVQMEEELRNKKGEEKDIAWGSQIRSYVFQPYQLVKDHRTNYEIGNVQSVMDGNITGFLHEYLILKKNNKI